MQEEKGFFITGAFSRYVMVCLDTGRDLEMSVEPKGRRNTNRVFFVAKSPTCRESSKKEKERKN